MSDESDTVSREGASALAFIALLAVAGLIAVAVLAVWALREPRVAFPLLPKERTSFRGPTAGEQHVSARCATLQGSRREFRFSPATTGRLRPKNPPAAPLLSGAAGGKGAPSLSVVLCSVPTARRFPRACGRRVLSLTGASDTAVSRVAQAAGGPSADRTLNAQPSTLNS